MDESEFSLEFKNISMMFPGVLALDNVSFGVKKGTVHVIMGENGAGKSTLMKILNGTHTATEGEITLESETLHFNSVIDAEHHGVAMIYQELQYIPQFTVEKYLMLCREPSKYGFINWKKLSQQAAEILDKNGLKFDLKTKMKDLTVSEIQLLEITKAIISNNVKVLIMDEPTSALSKKEIDYLFDNIKRLKEKGITILYISHKMDEIFRVADYITVMRDGKHIRTAPASEFTNPSLVKLMVGREISDVYPKEEISLGDVVLEVDKLTSHSNVVDNVSFHVRAGEIVGLGGLMGAGRTEIVRMLFGLDPIDEGTIKVNGNEHKISTVTDAVKNGIAMVTEDRRRYGLILCRNILENISLPNLKKISKFGFIGGKKERDLAMEPYNALSIKATGLNTVVQTLSGGNQQKVIISKWMLANPKVLILDEPTRGIDVGAKYEIYKIMMNFAKQGMAVIMISSELPEFIGMCDRAYVIYNGKVTGELKAKDNNLTQENIIMLATGGSLDE